MYPSQKIHDINAAIEKVAQWAHINYSPDKNEDYPLGWSLPPELSRNRYACFKPSRLSKEPEQDRDKLKKLALKLYQTVMDVLGNDGFRVSGHNFSDKEKSDIITSLSAQGLNISEDDVYDIMEVTRAIRDYYHNLNTRPKTTPRQLRHASLNCYDYDRFKAEMKALAEIVGHRILERDCPKLVRITREAAEGENNAYPGRHLPFKIRGEKDRHAWRYQCLRWMDEILYTSDDFINNVEMVNLIRNKALENGIDVTNNISESSLKKLYSILSELINVEHTQERKEKYRRSVYEPRGTNTAGHKYKIYKGDKKLSAFMVDISIPEASHLRREIGRLRAQYFDDNREYFAEKFPTIALLGYMEELPMMGDDNPRLLNHLTMTDLVTVNYKPSELPELKKKVKQAVELHMPIAVKKNDGWEMLSPISIKEDRVKWVLIAKSLDSNILRIITPDLLKHTFNTDSSSSSEENSDLFANNIIGISPLIFDKPYQVTLELTKEGINDIHSNNSALSQIEYEVSTPVRTYYDQSTTDSRLVSFTIYLNDDFLNDLFRFDKTAKLISIEPAEVNDIYEEYFGKRMGKQRIPLQDRAPSMKTLKEPKKNLNE